MEAKDNVLQKIKGFKHYDLKVNASAHPVMQGSIVVWDSALKIAKEAAAAEIGDKVLGVSENTVPVSSNIDNGVTPIQYSINAVYGDICKLNTTAAEVYADFDAVYVGADAQTITKVQGVGQIAIGHVRLPSGTASITGASGVKVPVHVYSTFPVAMY